MPAIRSPLECDVHVIAVADVLKVNGRTHGLRLIPLRKFGSLLSRCNMSSDVKLAK